jgi:hypothetical protein
MDEDAPQAPAKPSQTPSWVTLGFVLGALFVLALPRRTADAPEDRPVVDAMPTPAKVHEAPKYATVDAVFEAYGNYAVWSDDRTEIALWSPEEKKYADCYEVVRLDGEIYFRPIPALTRPILNHGIPENAPLLFTETERQRQEWLGEVQKENFKAFLGGSPHPVTPAPTGKTPGGP